MRTSWVVAVLALSLSVGCRERDPSDAGMDANRPDTGAGGSCTPSAANEDTVELCTDGLDNDCSGFTDCNDFDCCNVVACPRDTACGRRADAGTCAPTAERENTAELCADGVDNDCSGFFDCGDFSCCSVLRNAGMACGESTACGRPRDGGMCTPTAERENMEALCTDGVDNDCNGFTDCNDFGCCGALRTAGRECPRGSVCNRTCEGEPQPENSASRCMDMCDNDGNGFVDCNDRGCCAVLAAAGVTCPSGSFCQRNTASPLCPEDNPDAPPTLREDRLSACTNGCDDDRNGFADCSDRNCCAVLEAAGMRTSCAAGTFCLTATFSRLCEGDDPADPPSGSENTAGACSNGCDDDRNGFADCDDRNCCPVRSDCPSSTFCGRSGG